MAGHKKLVVVGVASILLMGAGASAMALRVDRTAMSVRPVMMKDAASESPSSRANDAIPAMSSSQSATSPVIPAELRAHSERIRAIWTDGANLADHYVQFTVPCDGNDCRELLVGNLMTGEIVQTGMGFAQMPDLTASSSQDSARLVLSWINVAGANCARATYRWTGEQLAAESDIEEIPYEDAGCDRGLAEH